MNQETFNLLLHISKIIFYEFKGLGGTNPKQRDYDYELRCRLNLLCKYGLITKISEADYVITEYGIEVASFNNWIEYLNYKRQQHYKHKRKYENDLIISDFQKRTKSLPFLISILSVFIAILSFFKDEIKLSVNNEAIETYKEELKKSSNISENKHENSTTKMNPDSLRTDVISLNTP
jgi:hypothetical protein